MSSPTVYCEVKVVRTASTWGVSKRVVQAVTSLLVSLLELFNESAYRYDLCINTRYNFSIAMRLFCLSLEIRCGKLVLLPDNYSSLIQAASSEDFPTRSENILFTMFIRSCMSTR